MYYLALDAVGRKVSYLLIFEETMLAKPGGGVSFVAKAIYAPDLPQDGVRLLQSALRKWWRLDAKLLALLVGPRGAAERMAPEVEVEFAGFERCIHASVGVHGLTELHVGLVDVRPLEGRLLVSPLFDKYGTTEVSLEAFLRKEAQYKDALFQLMAAVRLDMLELAEAAARSIAEAAKLAGDIVERLPSSFDIIAEVLRRYNVDPKAVMDYVVREAAAELRARAAAAAPKPAGP